MAKTEIRQRERMPRDPEFERDEDEVDLGRYWGLLVARWWLPLGGLVAGIIIGYLIALGGSDVYRARAVVYLGQPLSPSGSVQLQSQSTNPSTVRTIITSEDVVRQAAAVAGMRPSELRGHVTSQAIAGSIARLGQTPLVRITVTGSAPRKIRRAANELADIVVARTSGYVATKIASYRRQLSAETEALRTIDQTIKQLRAGSSARGLSTADRLIIASQLNAQTLQRSQIVEQQTQTQQLLSVAQTVERGDIVTSATPVKTTARSRRNSVIVGGLIGLLLGLIAALLWEPAARIFRRPA
jgi:uncharacterized protein involved in exopolysaccharide biosynthesis